MQSEQTNKTCIRVSNHRVINEVNKEQKVFCVTMLLETHVYNIFSERLNIYEHCTAHIRS